MTDKEKRIWSLIANRSVISLDDIDGGIPTNYNSEICVVKLWSLRNKDGQRAKSFRQNRRKVKRSHSL